MRIIDLLWDAGTNGNITVCGHCSVEKSSSVYVGLTASGIEVELLLIIY